METFDAGEACSLGPLPLIVPQTARKLGLTPLKPIVVRTP